MTDTTPRFNQGDRVRVDYTGVQFEGDVDHLATLENIPAAYVHNWDTGNCGWFPLGTLTLVER